MATESKKQSIWDYIPKPVFSAVVKATLSAIKMAPDMLDVIDKRIKMKLESITNGITTTIQTKVEEVLRSTPTQTAAPTAPPLDQDALFKNLAEWLHNHPDDCRAIQRQLYFAGEDNKASAEQTRRNDLSELIPSFYKARQPDSELLPEDIKALVDAAEAERLFIGKTRGLRPGLVRSFIEDREATMTETLSKLTLAKTPTETVEVYARLFVLQGVNPTDTAAVKTKATGIADLAPFLRK